MRQLETSESCEVYALIAAAGQGSRMGLPGGKQLLSLKGRSVIYRSCEVFAECSFIRQMIVMASAEALSEMEQELQPFLDSGRVRAVLPGGRTRSESVLLGLRFLHHLVHGEKYAHATGVRNGRRVIVLVHDGARCLVLPEQIEACVRTIRDEHCGAGLFVPLTDTVRMLRADGLIDGTPDRERLAAMQTPQGADLDVLLWAEEEALERELKMTDDLSALEAVGYPIRLIPGKRSNLKITFPEDIHMAEYILNRRQENIASD